MRDALALEITDFIRQRPFGNTDHEFDRLVSALFAYQYENNPPYRRLCDSEAMTPANVQTWRQVPAVPAQAFKAFDLTCIPKGQTVAVFHSSGTTGGYSSKHYFDRAGLALYETSLRCGFDLVFPDRVFPDGPPVIWAMMPPPSDAPHSSLSHMLGTLGAERYFWNADARISAALSENRQPIILFGTAFAFIQLFDSASLRWRLPAGSRVIETGGFKGRTRAVPRAELYSLFEERLGIPAQDCYSEYGMSEMASQFYGRGLDPVKRGPHWVRTCVIDPTTGEDAPEGQPGLLRHYDLANFNSVIALQTQDLGTMTLDGFVLHGRATDAELRGCSLTVEELWAKSE